MNLMLFNGNTTFRCIRTQTYFYFIIRKVWYLSFLQPTSSLMGQSHIGVSCKGAWCCKTLVVAWWFWDRSPGNVSPSNLGLAWSGCSHSQTDKEKFANNRSLIYKCRQITNMLYLIWVSLLQWMNLVSHVSVSSRRLDSPTQLHHYLFRRFWTCVSNLYRLSLTLNLSSSFEIMLN